MERLLDPSSLGDHVDRLYRAAWGLCGSREDAEDLVQETYAKVLAKPRTIHGHDEIGYLLRALRNQFYSQHRRASHRPRTEPLPEDRELIDPRAGLRPDEAVPAREVFARISDLAPDFRDVLVAVDVVGLTYAETAKLVGVKEATVTSRLFRARARVAQALDPGMEPDAEGVRS